MTTLIRTATMLSKTSILTANYAARVISWIPRDIASGAQRRLIFPKVAFIVTTVTPRSVFPAEVGFTWIQTISAL
jgi:hypothetical protein